MWEEKQVCVIKLTLRPGNFEETEKNALVMQRLADQITTLWRDVSVVFPEDLVRDTYALSVSDTQSQGEYPPTSQKKTSGTKLTINNSPLISPALAKLSSFFPSASVLL